MRAEGKLRSNGNDRRRIMPSIKKIELLDYEVEVTDGKIETAKNGEPFITGMVEVEAFLKDGTRLVTSKTLMVFRPE